MTQTPRWPAWASTLIIRISKLFSVMASYLQKRGSVYYYVRRYPDELLDRFPRPSIRSSLKTTDERVALREMERLNARHEAEWAAIARA